MRKSGTVASFTRIPHVEPTQAIDVTADYGDVPLGEKQRHDTHEPMPVPNKKRCSVRLMM